MPRDTISKLENLLSSSDISTWTPTNVTFASAPDPVGGNSATRVIANSTNGIHVATFNISLTFGNRFTYSVVVKAGGLNAAGLYGPGGLTQYFTINSTTNDARTGTWGYPSASETYEAGHIAWSKELLDSSGNRTGFKRLFYSFISPGYTSISLGVLQEYAYGFPGDGTTTYVDFYCPQINNGFGEFPLCPTSGSAISNGSLRESILGYRNALYASEDLGNASYWLAPANSISSNLTNDWTGQQRGWVATPTAGAGSKYVTSNVAVETSQAGQTCYGSIEIGLSSFPYIALSFDGGSNVMWVKLTDNTLGTLNGFSATVTPLSANWRRIDFSRTQAGGAGIAFWPCDADGSIIGTGDGSTKYIVGCAVQYNVGGQYKYIRTGVPVLLGTRDVATTRTAVNNSQNLISRSNQFDLWASTNFTTVTKNAVNPFGTPNDAWTLIANATNSGHYLVMELPLYNPSVYTASIFVRKLPSGIWDYAWFWSGILGYSYFNMATGAFGTNVHGLTAKDYGNGWYRIIIPMSSAIPTAVGFSSANNVNSEAGNATTTGGNLYLYQFTSANWEGDPADTGGTAIQAGIRNKVL